MKRPSAQSAVIVILVSFGVLAQAAPTVIASCKTSSLALEVTEENGKFTVTQATKGEATFKSQVAEVSEIDNVDGLDSIGTIKSQFPDVAVKQITNALVTYVPNDVSADRSVTVMEYRDADGKTLIKTIAQGASESLSRCKK